MTLVSKDASQLNSGNQAHLMIRGVTKKVGISAIVTAGGVGHLTALMILTVAERATVDAALPKTGANVGHLLRTYTKEAEIVVMKV